MERVMDDLTESMYGMKRTDAIRNNICPICKGKADKFKDELSRKEHAISGLCQKCQDEIFS